MRFPTIATPRQLALAVALAGAFAAPASFAADLNDTFNFSSPSFSAGQNLSATTFADGVTFSNGVDFNANMGPAQWLTQNAANAIDPSYGADSGVFLVNSGVPGEVGLDPFGQTFVGLGGGLYNFTSFSLTMDTTSFGSLMPAHVFFLGADGAVVDTLTFSQVAGGTAGFTNPLSTNATAFVIEAGKVYTSLSFTAAAVPEPSEYALMGAGLLVLAAVARRRKTVA